MIDYFKKGAGSNALVFPLQQSALDTIVGSALVSPRVGLKHPQLETPFASYDEQYEAALEIVDVRSKVSRGEFPMEFMHKYYPSKWGVFPDEIPVALKHEGLSFDDPVGLANVVHMDNPVDMAIAVHRWVRSLGFNTKRSQPECIDFMDNTVRVQQVLAQTAFRNLNWAFESKYYFGVARPEEVLGINITHYPEGCPNHPSFPAGHSAAASATSVLISNYDLPDDVVKAVRDASYIWAMARCMAGVHYGLDSSEGLKVGGLL